MTSKPIKKVLIAHQSTIPHYRAPFYQAVHRLKPNWWEFTVVYNLNESRDKFFLEHNHGLFHFGIEESKSYTWRIRSKSISIQDFLPRTRNYDLTVVGTELNNISYPLSYLCRFAGKSIAYWGHGRDSSVEKAGTLKRIMEKTKIWLVQHADGFFAYTKGVRDYMLSNGVDSEKVFVLNNTIDIEKQRASFNQLIPYRDEIRRRAGLECKRVLLFVGRLNKRKRLEILVDAFELLKMKDSTYHLIIIGGGDTSFVDRLRQRCGADSVDYYGVVSDDKIGCFYVMSDLYVFPGAVGLGPLQALSFDLTPVVIDSPVHNPEYEYLNERNSLILPRQTTASHYALGIDRHLQHRDQWMHLRLQAWPSIKHLTIENMAINFIRGIDSILRPRLQHAPL